MLQIIKYNILLLTLLFILNTSLTAQAKVESSFHFDAVVFRSQTEGLQRVDIYTVIPFQTLTFLSVDDVFVAKYEIFITVIDSLGNKIEQKQFERSVREDDYFVTQGGTGKFDFAQTIVNIPSGVYSLKVTFRDGLSSKESEQSRSLTVIDFWEFDFSISGILLVSSIEERDGRYVITPHISDNVGNLKDGFFAFFEAYNYAGYDNMHYVYEIIDGENKVVYKSATVTVNLKEGANQQFINIPQPVELTTGGYVLRLYALKDSVLTEKDFESIENTNIIAVAQRSIRVIQTMGGSVITDLNEAIRQLRYVADTREINSINEGDTQEEKLRRFEAYWKELDPTPNTERNEAFDEYYARVSYANRNFGSYSRGWMSDKGMVYIIFGAPLSVERARSYADNKFYERWVFRNNREFVFVDNTGFGDYRLVRPLGITERYRYSGSY